MQIGEQCQTCGNDYDPMRPCRCPRMTPEECVEEGGHVYEMSKPPPLKCTFCGYTPEQPF